MRTELTNQKRRERMLLAGAGLLLGAAALPQLQVARAQAPAEPPAQAATVSDEFLPKKYRPSVYQSTISESPFEREILPPESAPPPPPPEPFKLKLVGAHRFGDRYRITLVDNTGNYQIVTDDPSDNQEGFHYLDIEPSPMIQKVRVHVAKGSLKEWVDFDPKRFAIASKAPAVKAPTNSRNRQNIVPTRSGGPPSRNTPTPQSPKVQAQGQRSGAEAMAALNRAREAANQRAQASSRAPARKVVLPPPPNRK